MDFVDLIREKRFLGQEFLTWVWYMSEVNNGLLDVPGFGTVEVWFVDRLVLESGSGNALQQVTCKGKDLELAEARIALQEGKKVSQARLRMAADGKEWQVTLKADGLDLASVRAPKTLEPDEEEAEGLAGRFLDRLAVVQELARILDGLYGMFLAVRLKEAWIQDVLPRLREWAEQTD